MIVPPPTTAVRDISRTPASSPIIIFIVFLMPIAIPIVRDKVIQRPGVIEIMKKTGIKKYNKVKSKIMKIKVLGNNNDKRRNYYPSKLHLMFIISQ